MPQVVGHKFVRHRSLLTRDVKKLDERIKLSRIFWVSCFPKESVAISR